MKFYIWCFHSSASNCHCSIVLDTFSFLRKVNCLVIIYYTAKIKIGSYKYFVNLYICSTYILPFNTLLNINHLKNLNESMTFFQHLFMSILGYVWKNQRQLWFFQNMQKTVFLHSSIIFLIKNATNFIGETET